LSENFGAPRSVTVGWLLACSLIVAFCRVFSVKGLFPTIGVAYFFPSPSQDPFGFVGLSSCFRFTETCGFLFISPGSSTVAPPLYALPQFLRVPVIGFSSTLFLICGFPFLPSLGKPQVRPVVEPCFFPQSGIIVGPGLNCFFPRTIFLLALAFYDFFPLDFWRAFFPFSRPLFCAAPPILFTWFESTGTRPFPFSFL